MASVDERPWPTRGEVDSLLGGTDLADRFGDLTVSALPAHASNRRYFRIASSTGETVMLMQLAEEAFKSEEISAAHEVPTELPFIDVGRFLGAAGLPVPRVLAFEQAAGLLLLDDLGDTALEDLVRDAEPAARLPLYEQAVDLLVGIQVAGHEAEVTSCIALRRRFDPALLRWELDHFREYGLEVGAGATLPRAERRALDAAFDHIVDRLAGAPTSLLHRDFQSRNLMVRDGRLHMIDFQDALVGPLVYDLVALLRDSYVELSPPELDHLVDRFVRARAATRLPAIEPEEIRTSFRLQTVQRKLKDAGRFVFIDRVKGNPGFLKHIPASYRYVTAALEQLPEYEVIAEVLQRYRPERASTPE